MSLQITDTHAHLDMGAFDADRNEVLQRAFDAGVALIVNPSTDIRSAETILKLSEREPRLFAAVGFHPHDAGGVTKKDIDSLAKLATHKKVVAIGETGLDFYRNRSPREDQLRVFEWELGLAKELKLPIIVYCREAVTETIALLRKFFAQSSREAPGVIHCFSSDCETLKDYLSLGFYISVGGYVTFPNSRGLCDILKAIPDDRLLLETDAPYLAPQSHRGKRNEPAYLVEVVGFLARIRGISPEVLSLSTTENACRLFRLPLPEVSH
ncbi:MAG: TatD family hydrolase [Chloroflexota bacterium]